MTVLGGTLGARGCVFFPPRPRGGGAGGGGVRGGGGPPNNPVFGGWGGARGTVAAKIGSMGVPEDLNAAVAKYGQSVRKKLWP